MIKDADTIIVPTGDYHSGSNYALFVDRFWQGKKGINHRPTSKQEKIRAQFELACGQIKKARKNKRLILVHNGDAIDGDHHNSSDVCSVNESEQIDIHVELMEETKRMLDWQRGDKLYYTLGTDAHTKETESDIAKKMNAEMDGSEYVFDELELVVNARRLLFVHHGPRAGSGANEGNPIRGWLKTIYYNALKDLCPPPDVVYSAHVHNPSMGVFEYRNKMNFNIMYGIITPPFQVKTRWAKGVAPVVRNKIGFVYQEIKTDGTICIPVFCVNDVT